MGRQDTNQFRKPKQPLQHAYVSQRRRVLTTDQYQTCCGQHTDYIKYIFFGCNNISFIRVSISTSMVSLLLTTLQLLYRNSGEQMLAKSIKSLNSLQFVQKMNAIICRLVDRNQSNCHFICCHNLLPYIVCLIRLLHLNYC